MDLCVNLRAFFFSSKHMRIFQLFFIKLLFCLLACWSENIMYYIVQYIVIICMCSPCAGNKVHFICNVNICYIFYFIMFHICPLGQIQLCFQSFISLLIFICSYQERSLKIYLLLLLILLSLLFSQLLLSIF